MIVTYSPADGEERTWEYKPDDMLAAEAEAIEDATGLTYAEFAVALMKGGIKARRALLWVLLKRDHPPLRHRDVSFRAGEVSVEWDVEETAALRRSITEAAELTDEEREKILAALGDPPDEPPPVQDPKGVAGENGPFETSA